MKKVLALILAMLFLLSLAACDDKSSSGSSDSPEKIVKKEAELNLTGQILVSYKTSGTPSYNSYVSKESDTLYIVTGKATIKDQYGDTYTGKYTVKVEYDPDTKKADVKNIDLETPTKN